MAYLRGGDRFAAHAHHRITDDLSPSARKNMLSSIRSFYRYRVSVQLLEVVGGKRFSHTTSDLSRPFEVGSA